MHSGYHYTMSNTHRYGKLTVGEADEVRTLVEQHGRAQAARLIGIYGVTTLCKAVAQFEIDHMTAATIRSHLHQLRIERQANGCE